MTYKLRSDEAIVLIGSTPPPARYFSFRSYLGFVEEQTRKRLHRHAHFRG